MPKPDADPPQAEATQEQDASGLPPTCLEDLSERLRQAVARVGWETLTPVQAHAIPYLLAGRDIMAQSRTGSGKTGAFVLPILERIDIDRAMCQAMILTPTRELAKQVAAEAERLAGDSGIRVVAVYGGVSYGPQRDAFRVGTQIVVGTPGRILDHLIQRSFSLDGLDTLVFDEGDRLLSMGFYPDMLRIHDLLPERAGGSYMFSATFPPAVQRLAGEFLRDPEFLSLSRDHVHVAETGHTYYLVPPMEKDRCLVRIIEVENPTSAFIFCNTKARCRYVNVVLQRFGYDADELTSDLTQKAREKVMERVRQGELRFLVATDVAARGIDIPDLSHVFIYEPPEEQEFYIHRAGRTGRQGAAGEAISLVTAFERVELDRIAKRYTINIEERPAPTDEDVQRIASQRVTALLEARLRALDNVQRERMGRFRPLGLELAQSEDESAIIAMLLDDYYQQTLHGSPPKPPRERRRESRRVEEEPADEKQKRRRGGRRRKKG